MIAGILMSMVFSQYKELMAMGIVFNFLFVLVLIVAVLLIYFSIQMVMPRASKVLKFDSQRLI